MSRWRWLCVRACPSYEPFVERPLSVVRGYRGATTEVGKT
jgi:hypothetical protein